MRDIRSVAALALLATACAPAAKGARGCTLVPGRAYGVSGVWTWLGPVGDSARICLEQQTPVRIRGTVSLPDGRELDVSGAVAPSGAVFLHTNETEAPNITVVAHRRYDTLYVDWAGMMMQPNDRTRDVYSAGIMLRAGAIAGQGAP